MKTATAKTAIVKTVKVAKSVKTAKPASVQAAPAQNVIMTALKSRFDKVAALELVNQMTALKSIIAHTSDAQLNAAQARLTQSNFDSIAQVIAHCDDKGKGKEQVKTIEKIVRFMGAVALDSETGLCNYLKVSALTTLQNDGSVSVREMVCALSKVAFKNKDIFAVREGFKNLAGYSIGTGNSQASQARQVFNAFGFYTGFVKGATNNAPKLTPYGEAQLRGLVFKEAKTA